MIFVSAGHHENAKGAKFEGTSEYDLTVPWADEIALLLHEHCIRVPNGTLKEKTKFINEHATKNDIAVEIHFNSAQVWKDQNANGVIDDGEMVHVGRGSETLYYPGSKKGKLAAEHMQEAFEKILPPNRGAKEGWYQMNPAKGVDYFLAKTKCIALIIEPEFIDNIEVLTEKREISCVVIANTLLEIQQELTD